MKKLLMALMISFAGSLSPTSYAGWNLRSCLKLLMGQKRDSAGRRSDSVPDRLEKMNNEDSRIASFETRYTMDSEVAISELMEIQKIEMNGRLARLFDKFPSALSAGHIVTFNDRDLHIVTPLGHGSKAIVYLVSDGLVLRSLKVLFDKNSYEKEKINYEFLEINGIPSARLIETDKENSQLLLSYIDGIPLSGILHNKLIEDELRQKLRIQLISFGERYGSYGRILPDNLILEISSGHIVFIDRE